MKNLVRFLRDESGATAIEYALIVAAVGAALAVVGPMLTQMIIGLFTGVGTGLNGNLTAVQ